MFENHKPAALAARSLLAVALGAALCSADPALAAGADTYPAAHSDSVGAALSDTAITADVKGKLVADPRVHSSGISVTTTNGVVTLSGTADPASQATAVDLAQTVDGVKSVDSELTSADSPPKAERMEAATRKAVTDTWITTKVKSAILADSVTKGFEVSVKTVHGVVVLAGQLANHDAIDHVRDLAQTVEGVKSVDVSQLTAGSG